MGSWSELPRSLERSAAAFIRAGRLYLKNGSVRAWIHGISYALRRLAGQAVPQTAFLAVTYRCPCRCPFCYAALEGRDRAEEMPTGELKAVIDQVKAIGAINLVITGGEPLLREDIAELVAHAHRIGLITRLATSGILLTRDRVRALSRVGLNRCGVAIDDADPAEHDRLRGVPGLFDLAMQGFRLLEEHGIEGRLISHATHENLPRGLEDMLVLAKRLGLRSVHFNIPAPVGRWDESFEVALSEEEMERLRRLRRPRRCPHILIEFPTPRTRCLASKGGILYINALGEVTMCAVIPFPLGNLRAEPLSQIWKRNIAVLRLDHRGNCPTGHREAMEAYRAHSAAVLAAGPSTFSGRKKGN